MAIELKKRGDKINLNKKNINRNYEININLNWNAKIKDDRGFLSRLFSLNNSGIDLDLGCLYELKNGKIGVVQALGKDFGSLEREPFIMLDKDDRSGASDTGENLFINGEKISEIKRVLVFTYIYEGAVNWATVDGVVTIKDNSGEAIIIKMDEHSNKKMCALAMLENYENSSFSIEKIVSYFNGHEEMDRYFKWGLTWTVGRK